MHVTFWYHRFGHCSNRAIKTTLLQLRSTQLMYKSTPKSRKFPPPPFTNRWIQLVTRGSLPAPSRKHPKLCSHVAPPTQWSRKSQAVHRDAKWSRAGSISELEWPVHWSQNRNTGRKLVERKGIHSLPCASVLSHVPRIHDSGLCKRRRARQEF